MAKIRSRALSVVAIFSALGPFTVGQAQPCTGWELRATSGPFPRFRHSLAYDSARQVTVLFGGMNSGFSYKSDTWEWDGNGNPQCLVGRWSRARLDAGVDL